MAELMAGVALVGAAVQIYGQITSAQDKADAERRNAGLKKAQADELMSREAINEAVMAKQEGLQEKDLIGRAGSSGIEGGYFGGMMKMRADLAQNIAISNREATFKANLLNTGASIDTQLASDTATAGSIAALGSGLQGAGNFYNNISKPSTTPMALPETTTPKT